MARLATSGDCSFCGQTFSKAAMGHHLNKCTQRKVLEETSSEKTKLFHILVQGRYAPQYWMHLEVAADAMLKALDSFLRDIWLECCGHLSAFTIAEGSYWSSLVDAEPGQKSMRVTVGSRLKPGMSFIYEYDFGTTTTLSLRVLAEREGSPNELIQLMARNDPPALTCAVCGKKATQVCSQCILGGEGWLCNKCAKSHECGEEMLLPVVNSPRVGMCAYTG